MSADKTKRVTPYQRLAEQFDAFKRRVRFPRVVSMWVYPKNNLGDNWSLLALYELGDNWSLLALYERTKAAEQLGYDVQLYATDDGLQVKYVQKRPE